MKSWLASLTERQKFWIAVGMVPISPLLFFAAVICIVPLGIGALMWEACHDLISSLCNWAGGKGWKGSNGTESRGP